ncbi:hypothetical protein [Pseudomonas sp. GM60]|nr:hypothetical protein [Pseudomonas sp. GM60]
MQMFNYRQLHDFWCVAQARSMARASSSRLLLDLDETICYSLRKVWKL